MSYTRLRVFVLVLILIVFAVAAASAGWLGGSEFRSSAQVFERANSAHAMSTPVNAITSARGGSRVLPLAEQPAMAACNVFCGLHVTDFDGFLCSFVCHFILLSI